MWDIWRKIRYDLCLQVDRNHVQRKRHSIWKGDILRKKKKATVVGYHCPCHSDNTMNSVATVASGYRTMSSNKEESTHY